MTHAIRAFRNAFLSPGFRLFGLRFSRDYLRFAWRAARRWGSIEPGSLSFLGYRLDYFNQSHALFLVHEIFVNAAYSFTSRIASAHAGTRGGLIRARLTFGPQADDHRFSRIR